MAILDRFPRYVIAIILFLTIVSAAQAQYSGGTGEPNDPYQIATAADLIALGETPEDYDKHFILTADIDLDPNLPGRKVFDRAVIAPDMNDATWSFEGTPFTGVFDGNGHTISHLTINGETYAGLFGQLEPGGEVKDVRLDTVNIGGGYCVGGLAGSNGATVFHCCSAGVVDGSQRVGGLVGYNYGAVAQCYSTGAVRGTSWDVGGLVGLNWPSGDVTACYSAAGVSGGGRVGGLVGCNVGQVTECYSIGSVGGDEGGGGLVGSRSYVTGIRILLAHGTATHSFWDIDTSGQATSAGGTGLTTAEMQDIQTYIDAGWDWVGEVENGVSEVWQMLEGSGYPVLSIFSGRTPLLIQGMGTLEDPYLISDALELAAVVHYSPRAHYRLAAPIDLSGIRWHAPVIVSFGGVFDCHGLTVSRLTINGGGHLGLFGRLEPGAEIKDLHVVDVNITGTGNYIGGLVAQNRGAMKRCSSNGSVRGEGDLGGLVGINNAGMLTDCHTSGIVLGPTSSATEDQGVGGLVGTNYLGTVTGCYNTASVTGGSEVGGLVGDNNSGLLDRCHNDAPVVGSGQGVGGLVGRGENDSDVSHCYNTGEVRGGRSVGGLVGDNWGGECTCSYSTGAIFGVSSIGGLLGYNSGTMTKCYSSGWVDRIGESAGGLIGWGVGIVTECFWDSQTSGQATSSGGTGKTTAEMQTQSTFTDAGWDFVDETENGTDDIWWILEGQDYPRLWWELIPEN